MEIKFKKSDVMGRLKTASAFTNSILEVCAYAQLTAMREGVSVKTFNLGAEYVSKLTAEVVREGVVLVKMEHLIGLISRAPDDEIVIKSTDKTVQLRSGRGQFRISSYADATALGTIDMPEPDGNSDPIFVESKKLLSGIAYAAHAVAIKDVRYYLNGVFLRFTKNELATVGSDGHRMAFVRQEVSYEGQARECIIPLEFASKLTSALPDTNLSVWITPERFRVQTEDVRITCSTVSATYVSWERIVKSFTDKPLFTANCDDVLAAVDRALVVMEGPNKIGILFKVETPESLEIEHPREDQNSKEIVTCEEGSPDHAPVSLAAKYVRQTMDAMGSGKFDLFLDGSNGPTMFAHRETGRSCVIARVAI